MLLCLESNIDDLNPELYPYIIRRILEAGAKDAWLTPIIMKHGRPAVTLSVLLDSSLLEPVSDLVFSETSTFGIRWYEVARKELARSIARVSTPHGEVAVKIALDADGRELHAAPEFQDCQSIAENSSTSLKSVYREALIAYEKHKNTMK